VDNWPLVLAGLEAGKDDVFDGLARNAAIKTESHSIFTLYANETNENYLSIENKVSKVNDKGEVEFDTVQLVENIEISETLSNKLAAL